MEVIRSESVYATPWFQLMAKTVKDESSGKPYYCLKMADYISVVAVTKKKEIVLVRQYRPSVEKVTLELPSGHVESGELPEDSARRELLEETGYEAKQMELLGSFWPDTGRLSNKMWCYFSRDVERRITEKPIEAGIEPVLYNLKDFFKSIEQSTFNHALNMAPILMAVLKHKISVS